MLIIYRQNSIQNAYVLLYERHETLSELNKTLLPTNGTNINGVSTHHSTEAVIVENKNAEANDTKPPMAEIDALEIESMNEFKEVLREKNRSYFTKKILFNPDYSQFLVKMLSEYTNCLISARQHQTHSEPDFFIFQFLMTAFLTTVLRNAEKVYSYEFLRLLLFNITEVKFSFKTHLINILTIYG